MVKEVDHMKLDEVHPTPHFVLPMLNSVRMVHSMFLISVVQLLATLSTPMARSALPDHDYGRIWRIVHTGKPIVKGLAEN